MAARATHICSVSYCWVSPFSLIWFTVIQHARVGMSQSGFIGWNIESIFTGVLTIISREFPSGMSHTIYRSSRVISYYSPKGDILNFSETNYGDCYFICWILILRSTLSWLWIPNWLIAYKPYFYQNGILKSHLIVNTAGLILTLLVVINTKNTYIIPDGIW